MNRTRQKIYLAVLVLGFLVCIGVIWALDFMNLDHTTTQAPESAKTQSAYGGQDVLDSNFIEVSRQNRLNAVSNSLSHNLNEHSNVDTFSSKRALLSLVSSATEQELLDIFHDNLVNSTFMGTFNATPWIQSVVLTKLVNVNVERARFLIEQLDARTAKLVVQSVTREWNQVHKNEAIKFLALLNRELRILGLRGLIDGGNRFSRSDLIEIGKELNYEEDYVVSLLDQSRFIQPQVSWSELEEEFENIDMEVYMDKYLFGRNARRYVLAEGLDSLSAVLELIDRLATENLSHTDRIGWSGTRSRLVTEVSQDDPQAVFEYVAQLGEEIDVGLLSAASEVWFTADSDAFWGRLQDRKFKDVRDKVAENVIRHWSWYDPDLMLTSLEKIPSEYHDVVYIQSANGLSRDAPFQALELLPYTSGWSSPHKEFLASGDFSLEDSLKSFSIGQIVSRAAEVDPIATIEWINSEDTQLHESMKPEHLNSVFRRWSGSDPVKAFEMALQSPLQEGKSGAEASVVQWLAHEDLNRAIEFLPRVRDGETKMDAYHSVSSRLVEFDRISEAVQLGNDLPEDDRETYHQLVALSVGNRASFAHLIDGIRQLPTQDLQSGAARSAISGSIFSNNLTEKQIDQLKEYLTAADKHDVESMEDVDMNALMDKLPENVPTDEEGMKKLMKELNVE